MSVANQYEMQMLALINAERAKAGLQPLKINSKLNTSAETHSSWMLNADVFSHTGANGSTATDRMKAAGYVFSGSWFSGENIVWQSERGAVGISDDVINLHQSLMNSPGHRANILNPNFTEIGIGIEEGGFRSAGTDWPAVMVTQNFARSSADNGGGGVVTPPPPPPVNVTEGADVVTGTALADVIDARGGADRVSGLAGADNLRGGLGDDNLSGGADNDTVSGDDGNDTITGDDGNDLVLGMAGDDRVYGGNGADTVVGHDGNDLLDGGAGIDVLWGDQGNDTLFGGSENDWLHGQDGLDSVDGGAGDDVVLGYAGDDTVRGGDGNDLVVGHIGNDILSGDVGNDTLWGDEGDDNLSGGIGNDGLNGGIGNDALDGGAGFDWLDGGLGNDLLTGGADADSFVFRGSFGADRVTDFADNIDTLVFAAQPGGTSVTAQAFVDSHATIVGGAAVFDLGGGNILTVNGIDMLSKLYDDVSLIG